MIPEFRQKILTLVNGRLTEVTLQEAAKPPVMSDEERLRKYQAERGQIDHEKKSGE
jgi:hypothetical protein